MIGMQPPHYGLRIAPVRAATWWRSFLEPCRRERARARGARMRCVQRQPPQVILCYHQRAQSTRSIRHPYLRKCLRWMLLLLIQAQNHVLNLGAW